MTNPYILMKKLELKQLAVSGDTYAAAELQRRKENRIAKGKKAKGFDI